MSSKTVLASATTFSTTGCDWSASELSSLIAHDGKRVVSVFMPTHLPGPSSKEDHIRLKNLLNEVAAADPSADTLVEALRAATAPQKFWAHPSLGLALFADERGIRQYRLPVAVPEFAIVGRRPHVTPLLPLLEGDGRFYLLELHQHGIRLHEGSKFGLQEIIVAGFSGTAEEHQHTHVDRSESSRTGTSSSPKHVHFGTTHEAGAKERALKYFRAVDEAIRPVIQASDAPLLTSGVEWLQSTYAEISKYPRLITSGIHADTAALGTGALHERAWSLISQRFEQVTSEALDRHAQLRHAGKVVEDVSDVIRAISSGRVSSLAISRDRSQWGTIDDLTKEVTVHYQRQPRDEDLFNSAAVFALNSGAQVWAVDADHIPGGTGISACLRF